MKRQEFHTHTALIFCIFILAAFVYGLLMLTWTHQHELENIRNIDHTGQVNSSDTQYQLDQLSRHIYDLNVGKISQAEFAKRVEAIEPRSPLLKIEKHKLEWEKK